MKERKRIVSFIKQYFVFSRSERRGIYALLLLIAVSASAPRIWVFAFPPEELHIRISDPALTTESNTGSADTAAGGASSDLAPVLFPFDPNLADSAGLLALGFSPRAAHSMISYRNKGGRFRQPGDLYRVYYTDSVFITSLLPYVRIAELRKNEQYASERTYETRERKASEPLEMNTADSVSLVALYGIGPKMAAKIIDYRSRSGGFFRLGQLTEIYGIDEGLLEELKDRIYVDASRVRYIDINTVSLETLRRHPYLRYRTASAIINYRSQHGPFRQVEDLKKIVILPDSVYNRLLPYLRIND